MAQNISLYPMNLGAPKSTTNRLAPLTLDSLSNNEIELPSIKSNFLSVP